MRGLFLALIACLAIEAHGPLHEQIESATKAIGAEPGNGALYVRRAELRRLHAEFADAREDLARAERAKAPAAEVGLARARLLMDMGDNAGAEKAADAALRAEPGLEMGYLARAQARSLQANREGAAADYAETIRRSRAPEPDYYLSWARALAAMGKHAEAIAAIDAGTGRLGRIAALEQWALELEQSRGNWDGALRRLEVLAAQTPRKEVWLTQKGEILQAAGRRAAAREAFAAARAALEMLPESVRRTRAMEAVAARVAAGLASK